MSENDERPMNGPEAVFLITDGLVSGTSEADHDTKFKSEDLRPHDVFFREARSSYHWELRRLKVVARRKSRL